MPNTPKTQPTTLLQGTISHLRTRRGSADFLFNQTQKDNLTTAILADFVSVNEGIGASLSSMSDITVERADYLTFVLDGKNVEACVWASNFRDGDEVSVVTEQVDESWKGFAIYRPEDGLVAVYPHCTRGRFAHIKATGRWILVIGSVTYAIVIGLIYVTSEDANDFIEFAKLGVPVIFATTVLFAMLYEVRGNSRRSCE